MRARNPASFLGLQNYLFISYFLLPLFTLTVLNHAGNAADQENNISILK